MDYSLYLVTGRDLVPSEKDFYETVEEALRGGVTVVQVREKTCDTLQFYEIALKLKQICSRHSVPIIVNDRVDIALAVKADGVHLGQTDMPISVARSLLPAGSIIGISCNNVEHAERAINDGADYIGVGAVWDTRTKNLTNPVTGVRGVREVLTKLEGTEIKAVAIGGIKTRNLLRTLYGCVSPKGKTLDGIAIVSEIMTSPSPQDTTKGLSKILNSFREATPRVFDQNITTDEIIQRAAALVTTVRKFGPLIHQITNNVVMTQSANVTLALGASPIMATSPTEMEDISKVSGALLVNFGTIGDKLGMIEAGRWGNLSRKPIVFDPVAVGATTLRRSTAKELLDAWQATVIKGNGAEIGALSNSSEVKGRGVDSVGPSFADPASVVKRLAVQERCIIVLTGATDWISDGRTVVSLSNGHSLLESITGAGCITGTCIATFCAAESLRSSQSQTVNNEDPFINGDMMIATIAGILTLTVAAELAAVRDDVKGSGTFLPALIDELYNLTPKKIIDRAKVQVV